MSLAPGRFFFPGEVIRARHMKPDNRDINGARLAPPGGNRILRALPKFSLTMTSTPSATASPTTGLCLDQINGASQAEFMAWFGPLFEHSPWVAERAWQRWQAAGRSPLAGWTQLFEMLVDGLQAGSSAEQLALLNAHPELAGRAARAGELTVDSSAEQQGAGLNQCSPAELATLDRLNASYRARFGWPFILAVRGYDRAGILAEFARRVASPRDEEFATCLAQVVRIARLRLAALVGEELPG